MRKRLFLFIFILAGASAVVAQAPLYIKTQSGDDINRLLGTARFLFSEFQEANVFLRDGKNSAWMNYNLLTDEMQFIDKKGDTLALKNPDKVIAITFGTRVFKYTARGYVEILATGKDYKSELQVKRAIKQSAAQKNTPYGGVITSAASIKQVYSRAGGVYELFPSEAVSYIKESLFYLAIADKYRIANRTGFLKTYSKRKNAIGEYLKQHPVSFNKEADILRLFEFCADK